MLLQTFNDLVLFPRVGHVVIIDNVAIDQSLHIELFLENGHHESVTLRRFKLLVLLSACIYEFERLVLVLELDLEALLFGLLV